MTRHEVLVAGGGLAALEFVLALRAHAGDRVDVTLVAPDSRLLVRPALVAEPLGFAPARPFSLQAIADDLGITLVLASVASVDGERSQVVLRGGGTRAYDTLVLAPGARRLPAFDDAIHLGDEAGTRGLEALRDDVTEGAVSHVVFVAPTLTGWLLPLYEAALLTARLHPHVDVALVSAEERPLELFGGQAAEAVAGALDRAGVRFLGERHADVGDGFVVARGRTVDRLPAERVVALPLVRGPHLPGVPETGMYGMIDVDDFGRVRGLPNVYAIGDATDFAIKQGAVACQQADAAAEHIAAHYGAPLTPQPFRPRLHAVLLTGEAPIILGDATDKLPGLHLAPYLSAMAPHV